MKIRKMSVLALILALMLTITACGGGKKTTSTEGGSTEGKILKANNTSEPGSLDPALAQGTHESWILRHTFEGLMTYDKDNKLVPAVAESEPEISEDGLTYTFKIREGLKWSNGDPLTAKDFEFAWKRLADPATASYYAYQMEYLKNGKAVTSGEKDKAELGVKAIDDLTLEVQLEAVSPFFSGLTAFYSLLPVNEKVVTENPEWAKNAETHVSNGAFKLSNWEHDSKIQIVKNENFYDADKVKLGGVDFDIINDKNTEWQKYESGELDITVKPQNEIVKKYIEEDNKELVIGDYIGVEYYSFNTKVTPFNNVKVRKAFSMAVDRDTITNKVRGMGDTVAEGIEPFGVTLSDGKTEFRKTNGNLITEDVTEAKKLFEEGLKEEGMTVADFNAKKFVLIYNTDDTHKKVTQAMQEMWKTNLGAEIQLENTDFQVKLDREKNGDFQLSRAGWVADYQDPMTMIDLWLTGASNNNSQYSNEKFDALINEAKAPKDNEQRDKDLLEAEKILMEDMPIMPLYFTKMQYTVKPNIKGVYNTLTEYPTLTYAEID